MAAMASRSSVAMATHASSTMARSHRGPSARRVRGRERASSAPASAVRPSSTSRERRRRLVEVARLPAGEGQQVLRRARHLPRRALLDEDAGLERGHQAVGVGQRDAGGGDGEVVGQPARLVELPPDGRQHRLAGDHDGGRLGIARRRAGSAVGGEGGLGLGDPAQFHQRGEAPEQAALAPAGGRPSAGPGR